MFTKFWPRVQWHFNARTFVLTLVGKFIWHPLNFESKHPPAAQLIISRLQFFIQPVFKLAAPKFQLIIYSPLGKNIRAPHSRPLKSLIVFKWRQMSLCILPPIKLQIKISSAENRKNCHLLKYFFRPGWPRGANFRLLGHCFRWAAFWENYKSGQIFALHYPTEKVVY
jgi:hypothetical protein